MRTLFRTIRFRYATAAEWATSTEILAVNEIAIISDDPTRIKWGIAPMSLQKVGKTFAQLPYIDLGGALLKSPIALADRFAVNVTATVTAANMLKKYLTSTSAAAVALTTDTAANIATALGLTTNAAALGTEFDFTVDNISGANSVTVTLGTNIAVPGTVGLTGADNLVVVAGSIGKFKLIFKDTTHALAFRTL